MPESALKASQMAMARCLRDPALPPPAGVESRRLKVYRELVYNNIEGFISGGFPVLRSLYEEGEWHTLVRTFIDQHRCHTPYFLEISQEFLQFLMQDYQLKSCDPPFMAELAHYEWVELVLDISEDVLPELTTVGPVLEAVVQLSPLALSLSYQFPVHRVGPGFRPADAAEPVYLVVYRNEADQVRFMELNATTSRLLQLVQENTGATVKELLQHLARELNLAEDSILGFGGEQIEQLIALRVVLLSGQ